MIRKKKKLTEKYGAKFSQESNLPSEIENQWLKSIEQYEKAHENSKMVTVYVNDFREQYKNRPSLMEELDKNF